MARLWPPLAVILALVWLPQPPPAEWVLGLAGWQAPALLTLLAGVFGLLHLSSNYLQSRVVGCAVRWTHNVGRANLVYFTLMRPGVLVHELAHAMAAALVGGRIVGFNILETSIEPGARGGQVRLGHVSYTIPGRAGQWAPRLKDAFVGLAPLPLGLLLIGGALALSGLDPLGDPLAALPAALGTWRFWLALVAVVEIADHMTPSSVDRKNWPAALLAGLLLAALAGAAVILLHLALPPAWWDAIRQGTLVLVVVLAVPIALNLLLGALCGLLAGLFRS